MAKAGALDCFEYSRRALLEQIELIGEAVGKAMQLKKQTTSSLFGDDKEMLTVDIDLEHLPEFDQKEILEFEKASLGFYVSGHPLDSYREELDKSSYTLSSELDEVADGSQALIIGKIEEITEKISKKGNKFGIANILDLHGNIEVMLFENRLKEIREEFDINEPIAFKVKVSRDGDFTRLSILKIESLKDAQKEKVKTKHKEKEEPPLTVAVPYIEKEDTMYKLFDLIAHNQGRRELKVIIKTKLADIELETDFRVTSNMEEYIKQIEGAHVVA